jgi:hypothetical protein
MGGTLESVEEMGAGLSIWRVRHPHWTPADDWHPVVTTTVVEAGGEILLIDPLAPGDDAKPFWNRLERRPPTLIAVLKPDHVRDVDLFCERFGARAFGPGLFFKDDIPKTGLETIYPGMELPGGFMALSTGRWGPETPLWLPEQQTIVFADALTERRGRLRVWSSPWDEEGPLRALRGLLTLPFRRVIVSHGAPVHDRAAYMEAVNAPPWTTPAMREWARNLASYRALMGLGAWHVDEND